MRFSDLKAIYHHLQRIHAHIEDRAEIREFRKTAFSMPNSTGFTKLALDTRRINQETDYNPRRNLQFYHRSEQFLNEKTAHKIKNLLKIKTATDMIKDRFDREPEWFDSYARVLNAALNRILRLEQQDNDYSVEQINYINELMYMRYRLTEDEITKLGEQDLEQIILGKDEQLVNKEVFADLKNRITNKTTSIPINTTFEYSMFEKLLSEVKATKENKNVKRSITITVNDSICDETITKQAGEKRGN